MQLFAHAARRGLGVVLVLLSAWVAGCQCDRLHTKQDGADPKKSDDITITDKTGVTVAGGVSFGAQAMGLVEVTLTPFSINAGPQYLLEEVSAYAGSGPDLSNEYLETDQIYNKGSLVNKKVHSIASADFGDKAHDASEDKYWIWVVVTATDSFNYEHTFNATLVVTPSQTEFPAEPLYVW